MTISNINKVIEINQELHDFFTKHHDDIEEDAGSLLKIISAHITSNNEEEYLEKTKKLYNKIVKQLKTRNEKRDS